MYEWHKRRRKDVRNEKKKKTVGGRDCRRQLDSLLSRDIFGKQEMTEETRRKGNLFLFLLVASLLRTVNARVSPEFRPRRI